LSFARIIDSHAKSEYWAPEIRTRDQIFADAGVAACGLADGVFVARGYSASCRGHGTRPSKKILKTAAYPSPSEHVVCNL
jgi:hypothetical protein